MKADIKSMLPEEIGQALAALGEERYRANQVFEWLWKRKASDFAEMTNLSRPLRDKLDERFFINTPDVSREQVSAEDGTIKYLWRLKDGNSVESVVMSYRHGNTVCISTQAGCRMGCEFCASTKGGLARNLTPAEMLDEIVCSEARSGKKISNVVLMGIGEPLDNFDNVIKFLRIANHPGGLNIGMRHISLSTCGLAEKIDKLAEYKLQLTLSVSLHAPDNETRSRLMPVNKAYDIDRLMASCASYFEKTGRRVSFEYAMIDGVNDSEKHAKTLARRLTGTGCHVNLIPLNRTAESQFVPSTEENMKKFIDILKKNNVNVTVRRRLGGDIDASCGQLRRKTGG